MHIHQVTYLPPSISAATGDVMATFSLVPSCFSDVTGEVIAIFSACLLSADTLSPNMKPAT